jgi:hypothetical protein
MGRACSTYGRKKNECRIFYGNARRKKAIRKTKTWAVE